MTCGWRAVSWLVLIATVGWSAPAAALVGETEDKVGLDGSVRTVTAVTINYDSPLFDDGAGGVDRADGLSQTLLRLVLAGRPTDWLSFELHGVQDLSLTSASAQAVGGLLAGGVPSSYRFTDASWRWGDEQDVKASLWLDRLNVKIALPWVDLTVGRQAITFGKAHFWNPLDVYLAFDPRQFDRDYKAGVDALRIDVPLGMASGITLVGALGRAAGDSGNEPGVGWYGASVLGRAFTNQWDWDISLQGGKIRGGYQVGGAVDGEIWKLGFNGEVAYFFPIDEEQLLPHHLVATAGLTYRFEFDLTVEAAYLYNGGGDPSDLLVALQRLADGRIYHLSRQIAGLVLSYEILPILNGSLAYLFSISDLSMLIQPGFVLSVSDEADLLFGAMIGVGRRPDGPSALAPGLRSEFGTYPSFVYTEFKYHF